MLLPRIPDTMHLRDIAMTGRERIEQAAKENGWAETTPLLTKHYRNGDKQLLATYRPDGAAVSLKQRQGIWDTWQELPHDQVIAYLHQYKDTL